MPTPVLFWGTYIVQPSTSPDVSVWSQGLRAKLSHRKFPPSTSPRRIIILLWRVSNICMILLQTILHLKKKHDITAGNNSQEKKQSKTEWPSHGQNELWNYGKDYATRCLQDIIGDVFAYSSQSFQNWTYDLKGLFFKNGIKMSRHNKTYDLKGLFYWHGHYAISYFLHQWRNPFHSIAIRWRLRHSRTKIRHLCYPNANRRNLCHSCVVGSSLCSYANKFRHWIKLTVINLFLIGIFNKKCLIYLTRVQIYVRPKRI